MELDEYRRIAEAESSHWWYEATRSVLRQLLEPHLSEGGRFADVGCGTGSTGGWMAARGTVVGVDFEPLALSLYGTQHGPRALVNADANRLPFARGSFDAVLCVTVLCHRSIPEPQMVVADLARLVRPGGVVALMEPGVRRLRRAHDRVTHSARRFSRRELAGLLTASGLDVVRSTGVYAFLVPAAAAKAVVERGRTASDVARNESGLGGVLPAMAKAERRWLANHDLPFGLSVVALARRPT